MNTSMISCTRFLFPFFIGAWLAFVFVSLYVLFMLLHVLCCVSIFSCLVASFDYIILITVRMQVPWISLPSSQVWVLKNQVPNLKSKHSKSTQKTYSLLVSNWDNGNEISHANTEIF